jgi:hypothetical protein
MKSLFKFLIRYIKWEGKMPYDKKSHEKVPNQNGEKDLLNLRQTKPPR